MIINQIVQEIKVRFKRLLSHYIYVLMVIVIIVGAVDMWK